MTSVIDYGVWSLVPLVFAIITAFITRSAIFSLFAGCLIGVVMTDFDMSASLGALILPVGLSILSPYLLTVNLYAYVSLLYLSGFYLKCLSGQGCLLPLRRRYPKPEHRQNK